MPLSFVLKVSASLASPSAWSCSWPPTQRPGHRLEHVSPEVKATLTSLMQRSPAPVCGSYCPSGVSFFWKNHWKQVSFFVLVT